MLHKPL